MGCAVLFSSLSISMVFGFLYAMSEVSVSVHTQGRWAWYWLPSGCTTSACVSKQISPPKRVSVRTMRVGMVLVVMPYIHIYRICQSISRTLRPGLTGAFGRM